MENRFPFLTTNITSYTPGPGCRSSWDELLHWQKHGTRAEAHKLEHLYKNQSYATSDSAGFFPFYSPTTFPPSPSCPSMRSATPRPLKLPTNQSASPQPKKNQYLTRNVFWFENWTVVYYPLPASCTCSRVSLPASRVGVDFIDSRFGQKQLGQCSSTGSTCGRTRR